MWRRPGGALAQAGGLQPAPPSRAHATPRSGVSSGVATVLPLSAARAGPSQRRRARPGRARQPRGQAMIGPPRDRATAPGRGTPDENRGRWSAPSPAIGDGDGTGTRTGVSAPWTARPGPGARVRRAILPPSTAPGKPSSNELGSCHPPSPPVAPKIPPKERSGHGFAGAHHTAQGSRSGPSRSPSKTPAVPPEAINARQQNKCRAASG
jgi:hypothetical protein